VERAEGCLDKGTKAVLEMSRRPFQRWAEGCRDNGGRLGSTMGWGLPHV